MRPKGRHFYGAMCMALCVIWLVQGCGEAGPDDMTGGETDCDRAAELVLIANDSLGSQLNYVEDEILEEADSSFRPGDIDFSGVNSLYEEAISLCPTNLDAQFGAAFTGLLIFLADEDLNNLYDRVKYLIDTMEANSGKLAPLGMLPDVNPGGFLAPAGIPLRVRHFGDVLPPLISLDYAIISTAADDPMINDLQQILESSLLPRIVSSRNRLLEVLGDASYTFTVTPEMQGNSGASQVELDRSDFRVFLAIMYAAEASVHIICARDLDIYPYNANGLENALHQDSSFLGLKPGGVGANHMSSAKAGILSAEVALETAIDHLLAEINTDQTYDFIKVYPEDEEELQDIQDSLAHYRTYFYGPIELEVTLGDNDTTLTVDLRQFFDNPMENPKAFLPGYTITLEGENEITQVCYTWDANTFAEWSWPDVTFNGLLPGMMHDQFKEIIMGDGAGWLKSDCSE